MMADLHHLLAIYVHAHQTGNSVPPHIDAEARTALAEPKRPPNDLEIDALVHDCLEEDGYSLRVIIRAALARYGYRPLDSSPPADGEVAELVADLQECADSCILSSKPYWAEPMRRAAELLERQALVPVAVSERLPRPSVKVLAHYFNGLGKERTICAIWVPAKTRSDSYGDDDFTEYDEESDTFYWPEGWYETIENWDDLGFVKVDEGEVIYWQPIPELSAHALPQPEVGE